MTTVFPPPQSQNNEDLASGVRATTPRIYSPYVFQPNFLKQRVLDNRNNNNVPPSLNRLLNTENFVKPNQPPQNQIGPQTNKSFLQHSFLDPEMQGRKKMGRRVIDWTSSCVLYVENRIWQNSSKDVPLMQPDTSYTMEMQIPAAYNKNPVTSVSTKFIRSATNKMKCPVYKVVWTPDGRRLVTGSSSGEFTLWNGTAFNFETILQAHDCAVRAMAWSKNDSWLITGDNQGYVKYWQLNMNNVKMYQAHKDQACRSVSFCPTDHKFATASDDGTVRIWDFMRCQEEKILRGHGADVKQVDWHPHKGLVASASKDLHTPVKLWDPKSGQSLTTLHGHKGTVMDVKWNQNGNWLLSASRDHLIKIYDLRNLKNEMQVFRGHKKEAFSVAWHPVHEGLFASGGSEGSIMFWKVGEEKEVGVLEGAHDSLIWSLAWHPLGHVLTSGSNDHSTKFWARNRPGDSMRDRYNQYLLPNEEVAVVTTGKNNTTTDNDESSQTDPVTTPSIIPGMGDADLAEQELAKRQEDESKEGIPGLDWSYEERPVPRAFMAAWDSNKEGNPDEEFYGRAPPPDMYREREFPPRNRRPLRPPHPHDEEFRHRPFPPSPDRRMMNRESFPRMRHPPNHEIHDSFSEEFSENENIPPEHRHAHMPPEHNMPQQHQNMTPNHQNMLNNEHQNMLPVEQQNMAPNQHNMLPDHQRPHGIHTNPDHPMNRPPEHNRIGVMDRPFQGPRPRMDRPWQPPHSEHHEMDYEDGSGDNMQYNSNTPMNDSNVMFFDENGEPLPSIDTGQNFQPQNNNLYSDTFPSPQQNQMHQSRMRGRGFSRGRGPRPGFHPRGGRGDGGPRPRFMEPNRGGWMRGRGGSPPHSFHRGRGRPPPM